MNLMCFVDYHFESYYDVGYFVTKKYRKEAIK
jgi:hypothetical protein